MKYLIPLVLLLATFSGLSPLYGQVKIKGFVFDSDSDFISDADSMVTFVKRKLGDDILSVELTKKQVWACFEESFCVRLSNFFRKLNTINIVT